MKQFNVPTYYNSNIIEEIRKVRETFDPRKKDFIKSKLGELVSLDIRYEPRGSQKLYSLES